MKSQKPGFYEWQMNSQTYKFVNDDLALGVFLMQQPSAWCRKSAKHKENNENYASPEIIQRAKKKGARSKARACRMVPRSFGRKPATPRRQKARINYP